jgi:hypothetical protein
MQFPQPRLLAVIIAGNNKLLHTVLHEENQSPYVPPQRPFWGIWTVLSGHNASMYHEVGKS